ncbi:AAA family ATPase [Candidatus Saccharibacteria bacterium]|nr:AAA family ATPase [Candidatus Saccharibacteria bacterium]
MKSLNLSKPHVIVMVGIPGSGKSFFAEHFAETFNAPLISFGRLRDELFNEPTYSSDEQAVIRRVSDYMLDELFKTHRTIILEGVADTRTDRQEIVKRSRHAGYTPLFVWVQTESSTARLRVTKAVKGKSTITENQFDIALRRFTSPNASEKAVVISGKHTYASQLKIVLKRLVEPRVEILEKQIHAPRATENRTIIVR